MNCRCECGRTRPLFFVLLFMRFYYVAPAGLLTRGLQWPSCLSLTNNCDHWHVSHFRSCQGWEFFKSTFCFCFDYKFSFQFFIFVLFSWTVKRSCLSSLTLWEIFFSPPYYANELQVLPPQNTRTLGWHGGSDREGTCYQLKEWVWSLELTWWKETTNSYWLVSDLHLNTTVHGPAPVYTFPPISKCEKWRKYKYTNTAPPYNKYGPHPL